MPGINFRATSGYVSDGTGETHSLGEAYPLTRGGLTFGWATDKTASTRDRNAGLDRRLAGIVFQANGGATTTFRLNLPNGAGDYEVRLALYDDGSNQTQRCLIRDGTGGTVLATLTGNTSPGGPGPIDATGVDRNTPAGWVANNAAATFTFSADHMILELGDSGGSASTTITHVSVEYLGGGGGGTVIPVIQRPYFNIMGA